MQYIMTQSATRHILSLTLSLFTLLGVSAAAFSAPPAQLKVKAPAQPIVKATQKPAVTDNRVDINTASAAQLMQLKGIGKKRAEAIVKERETNGPFSSAMDLTRVKGIGTKTVENNAHKIKVSVEAPKTIEEQPNPNPNVK